MLLFSHVRLCDAMDCSTPGSSQFSSVQLLSRVWLFATPEVKASVCQAPLSSTVFQNLLKFMSIESVLLSNRLILCCPLLLLPSIFPSISPSSEYSGLISFRIDWFDLLAIQGTLLQHLNLKVSILQRSSLFYGPTLTSIHDYWKNHSFDYMDFITWNIN